MQGSNDFTFDKFMDDILIKEASKNNKNDVEEEDTPQRRYIKLYRERPHNRIRYTTSENK